MKRPKDNGAGPGFLPDRTTPSWKRLTGMVTSEAQCGVQNLTSMDASSLVTCNTKPPPTA